MRKAASHPQWKKLLEAITRERTSSSVHGWSWHHAHNSGQSLSTAYSWASSTTPFAYSTTSAPTIVSILSRHVQSRSSSGCSTRMLFTSKVTSTSASAVAAQSWKEVQQQLKRHLEATIRPSYDWVLGTGYNARVTILNALYTTQLSTHWARLMSILLAEAVTRGDPLAWCYSIPVTLKEQQHLLQTEKADAEAIAKASRGLFNAILNYLVSWMRLMTLLFLFAPTVLSAPIALRKENSQLRKDWLRLLRRTLERAGPAFIKWGQWAATRADLFPPDLCAELELLHTQAPAHGFAYTEAAIKSAFGFDTSDLFTDFEHVPVASGSIGQIHRAKISDTGGRLTGMAEGSVVAVKVRHPGVSESIERDFALMMAAARVAEIIPALRALRLEESLKQFAAPLREQVDLGREGYYLHAFNYNFRKESDVSFPVPLYPLVSSAVLVETFEPGEHISAYVARGAGAPYNSELAQVGARTMLHMMIVDNLVHSDLHPGNILVRLVPGGGAVGAATYHMLKSLGARMNTFTGINVQEKIDSIFLKPTVVLLDAGMATRLSPDDQINMVGLFDAFSRLDAGAIANWTLRFAGEEQTCPDPEAFRADIEAHFNDFDENGAFKERDTSNGAELLAAVLETVRQHQVILPGHICATVVTTLVLEGWSHKLDPAHSTLTEVQRIIALKKGETKLRKAAMWIQGAAVDREILENVPQFALVDA